MKKTLVFLAAILGLVLVVYIVWQLAKKPKTTTSTDGQTVDVVPPPPPPIGEGAKILSSELGDGKLLFDAYLKKFTASPADVAKATERLDTLSIFDGTNDKAWKSRFLRYNMSIQKVPTPQASALIRQLKGVDYFNSLWGTVDAVRAANTQIVSVAQSNLLPGNPEVNSNDFVQEILCPYVSGGCSSNDKKRNDAAKLVAKKAADDFAKILTQWDAYNSAATDAMKVYTISRLNDAGYKIV